MAKGALYWRLKDEQTGKWTYKKATYYEYKDGKHHVVLPYQEEQ